MESYRLGTPEYSFNPSIYLWEDKLWIAYRTDPRPMRNGRDSSIWIGELTRDQQVVDPFSLVRANAEDPRLFEYDGHLCCSFNTFYGKLQDTRIEYCVVDFENRCSHSRTNIEYGSSPEKNWSFWEQSSQLHFIYTVAPKHHVVAVRDGRGLSEHLTDFPRDVWVYGVPRGATPPVKIGKEYWSFFHSNLNKSILNKKRIWKRRKKVVYMGAYAFSCEPPFRVTRVSYTPLLEPSSGSSFIFFPSGAVFQPGPLADQDCWYVAYGFQDDSCRIGVLRHKELLRTMKNVP